MFVRLSFQLLGDNRSENSLHLLGALGQNHADHSVLVLNALGLLGALEKRDVEDETSACCPAQEVLCISIPANSKRVLPAAEDRVPRLGDKQGLFSTTSECGSRHIADNVVIICIGAARREGKVEVLDSRGGGVVILHLLPLDSAKQRGQVGTAVVHGVALFKGDVSTPMADLDIAFKVGDMENRLGELEANSDGLLGTGWQLFEGTVSQLRALFGWELSNIATSRKLGVVGYAVASGLDLSLLPRSRISRGSVGREAVG